ncbi:carboxylesterase/lipase family protein [Tamlana flava]|uniref:carboxylesterase/lipase family protein n=1 Tax=Tamlana flava TaxID=3158572 RepID=UPI00351BDBB9
MKSNFFRLIFFLVLGFINVNCNSSKSKTSEVISETAYGKVKGYQFNDVKIFRGIPYGADTGGENRFLPPQRPEKWNGVRECTTNGDRCYQTGRSIFETNQLGPWFSGGREDRFELSKQGMSEDCLNLNVLSPDLKAKLPVMVYFHGGGFKDGGGLLSVFSDKFVKEQNVVLVGVNHRLSVFGYAYLGGIDKKYKIGNPGQLDLIASLEWVRYNIQNFGGDPNNVMIFGESGGAAKVSCLLAMPGAKGLFHKAAIMSGAGIKMSEQEEANAKIRDFMSEIQVDSVEELLSASADMLMQKAFGFGPVVDGYSLKRHPFYPDAPNESEGIPLLIGTCKDETTLFKQQDSTLFSLDLKGLKNNLIKDGISEDNLDGLLKLYQRDYPEDSMSDLYFRISSDRSFRRSANKLAELQLANKKSKVWMYLSQYNTPIENGKLRAFHTYDLPLVMRLTLYPESEQLSRQMANAWAEFARTSDPSTTALEWPSYSLDTRSTMIFDVDESVVEENPNKEERELIEIMLKKDKPND